MWGSDGFQWECHVFLLKVLKINASQQLTSSCLNVVFICPVGESIMKTIEIHQAIILNNGENEEQEVALCGRQKK